VGKYILKRVLLMIPTFFAISMIVFLVMHAAPGQPGAGMQSAGDASQDADKGAENEAYTLFKQQFNLDKPVLFNTRYSLSDKQIRASLEDSLNLSETVSPARQIQAKEQLTDWGIYSVPGLYDVLVNHDNKMIRSRASKWLSSAAKLRLKHDRKRRPSRAQVASDSARMEHNLRIKTWTFEENASEQQARQVTEQWTDYIVHSKAKLAEVQSQLTTFEGSDAEKATLQKEEAWRSTLVTSADRWEFSFGDKVSAFFFDTQFAKYWSNILRLDFGVSHLYKEDVLTLVGKKLRYSIALSIATLLIIYLVSVPLGIWSAANANTPADRGLTVVLFMLYSLPSFWVATLLLKTYTVSGPEGQWSDVVWWLLPFIGLSLILKLVLRRRPDWSQPFSMLFIGGLGIWVLSSLFINMLGNFWWLILFLPLALGLFFLLKKKPDLGSVPLAIFMLGLLYVAIEKAPSYQWFPTGGFSTTNVELTTLDYIKDVTWHIALPVLCMTYGGLAALSRYARTGLLDVIQSDYVRTARAKGLSEGVVIVKHAARNGMIPIITLLATLLPALIGGSVIIEFIFQIPGIGSFMFESITARDYNVVMCILLIASLLTLLGMLLADLLYALVDPRITFD